MDAERAAGAWRFDRFTLDLARGALLGPDGAEVPLRPKSLALLRLLVENPGRVVDRDAIMAAVWPDVVVGDESITQCIRDIRKALGDEAQQLLKTVPKRGYLLAAEVTPAESTAPAPRVERRLAAILAADIVGYSRLIEQDEAATLAAIKALREQAIDPLLAEHKGRIVKLMGDGAIVEFASVVDAVACAVAMQKAVGRPPGQDAGRPADRVPHRRQPRRRGGRGRRPAGRRRQHRRPAGAAVRARRRAGLRHRLRPPPGPARAAAGVHRRAAGQEHRPAGAGVPGPAGWAAVGRADRAVARPARLLLAAAASCSRWSSPAASGVWPVELRPCKPAIAVLPFDNLAATRRPAGLPTGSPRTSSPTCPASATRRDRPQLDRGLQGQAGRRAAGRSGPGRPLRARGLRPAPGGDRVIASPPS